MEEKREKRDTYTVWAAIPSEFEITREEVENYLGIFLTDEEFEMLTDSSGLSETITFEGHDIESLNEDLVKDEALNELDIVRERLEEMGTVFRYKDPESDAAKEAALRHDSARARLYRREKAAKEELWASAEHKQWSLVRDGDEGSSAAGKAYFESPAYMKFHADLDAARAAFKAEKDAEWAAKESKWAAREKAGIKPFGFITKEERD